MTAGIYDQLSQLSQSTPSKTSPVGSPDASQSVKSPPKAQSPNLEDKVPAHRPTTPQADSQVQPATPTPIVTSPRDQPHERLSENLRGKSRELPTREEVQEFTFRLRDELKVKVQAEL